MTPDVALLDTPLGVYILEYNDDVIFALKPYIETTKRVPRESDFSHRVHRELIEFMAGERTSFDFNIDINRLSAFSRSVLCELQEIPYAHKRTYKEIATALGNPNASRAVGRACKHNPIHIIIPCHRVIGSNGSLTGYAAGIRAKERLLELEATGLLFELNVIY
ncbi:MAG: methylated-DNA--[protein]-cysteine S-methyltransferase [Rikenellaceae bacterium]